MQLGFLLLLIVTVGGTVGYMLYGWTLVEAAYQTVTTISTVGFEEVRPIDTTSERVFTISLILVGVGTALYTLTVMLEVLLEGRVNDLFGRRRMQRRIDELSGHVVVCGWGRVGRTVAEFVSAQGRGVVVVEQDPDRVGAISVPVVEGDATEDAVLRMAGVDRCGVIVAALNTDAENLYVTITARSLAPHVFIVARARQEHAETRLLQAGANRVVNPQRIGGSRMGAFAVQPNVAEFLDVIMHEGTVEIRMEEAVVGERSTLAGATLRDAQLRERTGALVLALRDQGGEFLSNPPPDTVIHPGQVLIVIGRPTQLREVAAVAAG